MPQVQISSFLFRFPILPSPSTYITLCGRETAIKVATGTACQGQARVSFSLNPSCTLALVRCISNNAIALVHTVTVMPRSFVVTECPL